jgi:hypothetical protein
MSDLDSWAGAAPMVAESGGCRKPGCRVLLKNKNITKDIYAYFLDRSLLLMCGIWQKYIFKIILIDTNACISLFCRYDAK